MHCRLPVPLTYDMVALLAAVPDSVPRPPGENGFAGLTEYASVRRYEEGFAETSEAEIRAAITAANAVVVWTEATLSTHTR